MKNLTTEEFDKAPTLVQFLHVAAISGIAIGSSIVNKAIADHPEYFKEELERKRKWDLVPNEVHSAYNKELSKMSQVVFHGFYRRGILRYDQSDTEYNEEYDKRWKKMKEISDELFKKYYGPYGL